MHQWRLTKYNPIHRGADGAYTRDEWTSVGDIGREITGHTLSVDEYLATEQAHLDIIERFLIGSKTPNWRITHLEYEYDRHWTAWLNKHGVPPLGRRVVLRNDRVISTNLAIDICKMCLRELAWCKLEGADGQSFIHFGWDYYVYLGCKNDLPGLRNFTETKSLYLEPFISPYL